MVRKITSLQNENLKTLLKLQESRTRKKLGLFTVEGVKECARALGGAYKLKEIYYCSSYLTNEGSDFLKGLSGSDAFFFELANHWFDKVVVREGPGGVLGVFESRENRIEDFELGKDILLLMLEGIEKPGNFGALLRTADGAGVNAVLAIECKVDLFNPHLIRGSVGSCFSIPIFSCSSEEAVSFCSRNEIKIHSAVLNERSQNYSTVNYGKRVALLLGSEDKGIKPLLIEKSDVLVKVPMLGQADSLNVSAAGAVLLYEIRRQLAKR